MSLVSICPACHHENLVSNTTCDACEANLGAFVFETDVRSRSRFMVYAIALTVVLYVLVVLLKLGPLVLVTPFYAALLVSYMSPTNVVSEASWGALIGLVGGALFALLAKPAVAKAMGAMVVAKHWVIGFFLVLLLIYPFCVLGATAGEALSARRRKAASGPQPIAPTGDIK